MTTVLHARTPSGDDRHRADLQSRSTTLPTRLRPADLMRITDQGVADVLDGVYDHVLPPRWDPVERWATRLVNDDELDVWLISWTPDRSTELHDHAGSLGALTVVTGCLREYRWTGGDLSLRVLRAGDQASFPLGWVHDVQRHDPPAARSDGTEPPTTTPTLSVHAYSPPLTAMSFYAVTDHHTLRRTRTELTDRPE
ncbi:cysteine dioxygenase [Gordonia prachuapensis]|uniref:cysteine dioxygenase n=1 Tax=Gordonia prachuapensis TaxID=3115651 RepID=UPI003D67F409